MINFSQTSEQIAEEIISYYKESTKFYLGYLSEKKHIELAINKVTGMLSVCDKFISTYRAIGSSSYYLAPNPNWSVLKSVLEILNSKLAF